MFGILLRLGARNIGAGLLFLEMDILSKDFHNPDHGLYPRIPS